MYPKARLDALSDGIFAVAMTLLVLDVRLPEDFHPHNAAELLKGFREKFNKPLVSHIPSDGISGRIIALLEKARIPVYPSPERAVKGLKALLS